mgnify:CR=1 FL=1
MGLFGNEFRNVVEWQESDDTVIFHKWHNDEIKKAAALSSARDRTPFFSITGKSKGFFRMKALLTLNPKSFLF